MQMIARDGRNRDRGSSRLFKWHDRSYTPRDRSYTPLLAIVLRLAGWCAIRRGRYERIMEAPEADRKSQSVGVDKLNTVEDLLNCNK